jgi:hypothetical protein
LSVGEDGVELAGEVVEDQYAAWADALSVALMSGPVAC